MLNVTVESVNDTVLLKCWGRIVHGEETRILCAALPHYGREITIDMSQVTAIDAAGIGALVALQAAGIYFRLANPKGQVREVLRLTKVDSIVDVCDPYAPGQVEDDRISRFALESCFSTAD